LSLEFSMSRRRLPAAVLGLLLCAGPAFADPDTPPAPTGFELKPDVTPEQVGACYATLRFYMQAAANWGWDVPPVWPRLLNYFAAAGLTYGPLNKARAERAAAEQGHTYAAFAADHNDQARAERLAEDASNCGDLVLDLE
jgi:hypothetical protein